MVVAVAGVAVVEAGAVEAADAAASSNRPNPQRLNQGLRRRNRRQRRNWAVVVAVAAAVLAAAAADRAFLPASTP